MIREFVQNDYSPVWVIEVDGKDFSFKKLLKCLNNYNERKEEPFTENNVEFVRDAWNNSWQRKSDLGIKY